MCDYEPMGYLLCDNIVRYLTEGALANLIKKNPIVNAPRATEYVSDRRNVINHTVHWNQEQEVQFSIVFTYRVDDWIRILE